MSAEWGEVSLIIPQRILPNESAAMRAESQPKHVVV